MANLEYNAKTGEPFLRLAPPFSNFIITPPRIEDDVDASVEIMNDPFVYKWMGRTTPYNAELAERWIRTVKVETDAAVEKLKGATEPGSALSACPVRHMREELADGKTVFVGDVGLVRSGWTEIVDAEERARLVAANAARLAGDPEIVWHIGYYLAPGQQGRGLMTAAVKRMIEFGVAWMNVKYIKSSAFEGNHGSLKVQQKNGFVEVDKLVDHVQVGEERRTLVLMEWRAGTRVDDTDLAYG
ncbi:gnat family [Favolaschia claudopus]|uniref:Gnat family n=1 Tax=Favolaschia claudopus TaxID=2862362 RepID=A0AAW0BYS8_9AGAR